MSLHIETRDCDGVATGWKWSVEEVAWHRDEAIARYDALRLDAVAIGFPTTLGEVADEMGMAAQVLTSTAAAARAADDFDGEFGALGEAGFAAALGLSLSINDGKGADVLDLEDPDPANDDDDLTTVHLGYLPLWGEGGPQADDVNQGHLSDCGLLAVLAGVAFGDREAIVRMVTDNEDGTYTVTFPDGEVVVVDDEFLASGGRPKYVRGNGVLWPLILEKAIVMRRGGDYGDVEGDDAAETMEALGYELSSYSLNPGGIIPRFDPSDARVAADISSALEAELPVTASARGDSFGVQGGRNYHDWTVVGIDEVDGVTMVTVRNPWGFPGMTASGDGWVYDAPGGDGSFSGAVPFAEEGDAQRMTIDPESGYVTMPIDMFTDNFDHIDVGAVED